jgi:hypothetical protein
MPYSWERKAMKQNNKFIGCLCKYERAEAKKKTTTYYSPTLK